MFGHPHSGHPLDRSKLRKRWCAAVKAAGLCHVRFHDLRHTFGTQMAAQGVPMRALQELMGHADFATALRYAPSGREADWAEAAFGGNSSGCPTDLRHSYAQPEQGPGKGRAHAEVCSR